MKYLIIISVCLTTLIFSCKKSSSGDNPYYFRASIDGAAQTFNVNAKVLKQTFGNVISISIIGSVSSSANLAGMSITINNSPSSKPIVAGSYSESNWTDFVVAGVYNPGSTTIVYGAGQYPSPIHPLQIIISSIDNNAVKGTFSGDFYYTNTATVTIGPDKKTFTNGEFYVKF